jgi:DNA repair protein RadC
MQQNGSRRKMRITDLPPSSRPREKLLAKGRANLTNEELLAILLGTGSTKQNALLVSKTLLKKYPLDQLPHIASDALLGIGSSKASRVIAALELGSRVFAPASLTKIVIRSTQDTVTHLRDIVGKKQEFLVVMYLNARYELLQREIVGQGGLNSMVITPKEIFHYAFQTPCASIIVAHNHPSGDPTLSDDDLVFTDRIQKAGEVLGITMLDHIIVGTSGFFSFRENMQGKSSKKLTYSY